MEQTMGNTMRCVFCEMVAGKVLASSVYDDDQALAFMDIRPAIPGHLLVVPKRHAMCLAELDEETGGHLFRTGMRLAAALRDSSLCCEGINFFLTDGAAAGQEIFHAHLHVIPRFTGDGFRFDAAWPMQPSRPELDDIASQIRQAYRHRYGDSH